MPNTTCGYASEYLPVTLSVEDMTIQQPVRLPYAEADTPHEMYADCEAAGANLRVQIPRTGAPTAAGQRHHLTTDFRVPEAAARLAGGLHLHLN